MICILGLDISYFLVVNGVNVLVMIVWCGCSLGFIVGKMLFI